MKNAVRIAGVLLLAVAASHGLRAGGGTQSCGGPASPCGGASTSCGTTAQSCGSQTSGSAQTYASAPGNQCITTFKVVCSTTKMCEWDLTTSSCKPTGGETKDEQPSCITKTC